MTAISVSERLLEMAAFYTPLALTVTTIVERLYDTNRKLSCMIELRRIRMFSKAFNFTIAHPALSRYPAFAAETEYQGIPNGWMKNC